MYYRIQLYCIINNFLHQIQYNFNIKDITNCVVLIIILLYIYLYL